MKYKIINKYKSVEKTEFDEEHIEEKYTGECEKCGRKIKWVWVLLETETKKIMELGKCCMMDLIGSSKIFHEMVINYNYELDQYNNKFSYLFDNLNRKENEIIKDKYLSRYNIANINELKQKIENVDIEDRIEVLSNYIFTFNKLFRFYNKKHGIGLLK